MCAKVAMPRTDQYLRTTTEIWNVGRHYLRTPTRDLAFRGLNAVADGSTNKSKYGIRKSLGSFRARGVFANKI